MKPLTNKTAVQLFHVCKQYEIHHEKPTLVEKFIKGKNEIFTALDDINLTINRGERVGIIGSNGSGKTTLLKTIAGISTPTKGLIKTYGKVISLINLESGFHEELSGIQNVYLNGMLLGLKKNEISAKLKNIIEFADLKQFIDAPLFTYSAGMKLRLGFSVAIQANPDVLILDEGIGVIDSIFQKKAQNAMNELFHKQVTFIVVTHWLDFVEKNCDRIIIMKSSHIIYDGSKKGLSLYTKWNR